ncbi:MAG: hypothetical protein OQK24_09810 [Magnetovibrio sp.]|nr:hypothetical protein [Magnetovibrio sp.]
MAIGLEANASSLEMIRDMDPSFIEYLKESIELGQIEFIGSGYVQIIGPLIPADVNRANLHIGNKVYADLLGTRPRIALVNEQAYSPGLVPLYLEAGYDCIIMDWAGPFSHNNTWSSDWQYQPQKVLGTDGSSIDMLWNHSISFQRFQKYVYGEMSLDEHLEYLSGHLSTDARAFNLYGSDVEVFDYRPKRYAHEQPQDRHEWERIKKLFVILQNDPRYEFVTPSDVFATIPHGEQLLSLESPDDPIPVKKQTKYNITRWAVSGRDDIWSNTVCWRAYEQLDKNLEITDDQWRNVCLKWRSDYRTHITQSRWNVFCRDMSRQFGEETEPKKIETKGKRPFSMVDGVAETSGVFTLVRNGHILSISAGQSEVELNLRRGLTIRSYKVPQFSDEMIYGTYPLGYYTDINWVADYYSGHLVAEVAGRHKVSDLDIMDSLYDVEHTETTLTLRARIETNFGDIDKVLTIHADKPKLDLSYHVGWSDIPTSNLRMGHVTLNPELFERGSLYYETHNGGKSSEVHGLSDADVNFGRAVSFLTSAHSCLGMTEGTLEIGDDNLAVVLSTDKTVAALVGMVQCMSVEDSYFCRASLSAREFDDTSRDDGPFLDIAGRNQFTCSIEVKQK